ncbi:MAG: DUF4340 domain-containing protein [Phycisphaerales bacterium]|nr:DUF4340 domain-containing protein [Phycisphaerales bacterium]
MNAKTLKILLVATVVVVVGAFAAQRFGSAGAKPPELPERVVPGLSDKINDVASIDIASKGKSVSLSRRDGEWVVASAAGYPARFESVKSALVELADLKPRERKTTDSARYARLGLGDPTEENDAVSVELKDASGGQIARVILGNEVAGGSSSQRYVRVASDPQTWLAEGKASPATDPMQWVDRELIRIPRDRVTRVTITHPDGEVVRLEREQGGSNYTLADLPEGRTPKGAGELGAPASALAYLRFDDVRRADAPGMELGDATDAVYETTDGLHLTVKTWQVDGKTWASFVAEYVAPPTPEQPEPAAAGSDAAKDTAAEAGGEKPKEAGDDADKSAATQKEASDLNSKLGGWLYQIPEYQAASFRKHLADLTEEAKAEAPVPEAAPGANAWPTDNGEDEPVIVPSLESKDPDSGG